MGQEPINSLWISDQVEPPIALKRISAARWRAVTTRELDGAPVPAGPCVAFFYFQSSGGDPSAIDRFRKTHPHVTRIAVLESDVRPATDLNCLKPHGAVAASGPGEGWEMTLRIGLDRSGQDLERRRLLNEIKLQNRRLAEFTENQEKAVDERTQHLFASKIEMEAKTAQLRSLIRFIKDLASVLDIEDLLLLLRRETKNFHKVKEPLLALADRHGPRIYYFQGSQVQVKNVDVLWTPSLRLRMDDRQDRQYLADQFGRPFAKVIAIPVSASKRGEAEDNPTSALLLFEHALTKAEAEEFLDFTRSRLQPLSTALDRLLLEADLKVASLMWEGTFDGLLDPVAILDVDLRLLRCNRAFQNLILDREPGGALAAFLESSRIDRVFSQSAPCVSTITFHDRVFEVHGYPITLSPRAPATTAVAHLLDVTRSRNLQGRIIQHEKMAAIGHLAGNIAHELNNPLTGIRSLAQLLMRDMEPESQILSDMREVEKAAERCQVIIKNLLEFSRDELGDNVRTVDLNDIVERTLPLLKTALRELNCDVRLSETPVWLQVAPQLVQQVVFNLVNNACQATPPSGHITIETRTEGDRAVFAVEDTGTGMSAEVRERIFEPFFTTKDRGKGTGLGLNMSLSVVRRFGGEIVVHSEVGRGSRFEVRLPVGTAP